MALMVASAPTESAELSAPRAVYIHVPFCRHRCGYCNFALEAGRDYLIPRYLAALRRELELRVSANGCRVDTVYFGGGTPSRLDGRQLDELFAIVRETFSWSAESEVSLEANPSDIHQDLARCLAQGGVNRVSLGAQSFHPDKLRILERDHDAATILRAVDICRSFARSVSLDLIFGAPGESLADWGLDLQRAREVPIDHLSTYELTFEKGTRFWNRVLRGEWSPANEDLRADMYELALDSAAQRGWEHYEISSFAAVDMQCLHNITYWNGAPFWGFGPGAASFIGGCRLTNHASLLTYCRRLEAGLVPTQTSEHLEPVRAAREQLAIGLRMLCGVDRQEFSHRWGRPIDDGLETAIAELQACDLLQENDARLKLTRRGILLYDGVAARILAPH